MDTKSKTPVHVFSPSQWINIGWLILAIWLFYIHPYTGIAGLVIYGYKYLEVASWRYEIYEDHVTEIKGVFDVTVVTVNYFRIKSVMIIKPFWMRLFGLSIVSVTSSEQFKTRLDFHGITIGEPIAEFLQDTAKDIRKSMGIKDFDIFNT
jgi:membrane protein YdbS with pleckstrin-like domain